MSSQPRKMWGITEALALLIVLACVVINTVECEPQVPCYFIFGDSLADVGNNNNLNTLAKANYPPYGIDFPGGVATGRFSNGITANDRITQLIGLDEFIPPYSTAKGKQILKGVNYASGAAGIRQETGKHLGDGISFDAQLENHRRTISKMAWMIPFSLYSHLSKCLYTITIGNNDYINNYFLPQYYDSSHIYSPDQYADLLIDQYGRQLKTLYLYGARKVAIFGAGLLGCALAEIYIHGPDEGSQCVEKFNNATKLFNQRLISLVDQLNSKLPGATFTYISTASKDSGPLIANATCCKVRGDYQCLENSTPCDNRNTYASWDGFHPTELVLRIAAEKAYNAKGSNDVHPVDIKTLISSDKLVLLPEATTEGHSYSS